MEHVHVNHAHPTPKLYVIIFAALMVFTLLTVAAAFQDFGRLNNVIALAIAGVKTVLVVLFFMHVKYGSRLTKLFAAAGFLWLAILIGFTLGDTESRRGAKNAQTPTGWAPLPVDAKEPGAPAVSHGGAHQQTEGQH
ncbi:MAG: oxidase [Deltaproteobacteria bacterium]|nr:oxidase [Deltaproteobacteria bacterium]